MNVDYCCLSGRQSHCTHASTGSPFFWAGFVLIGDGAVAPALEPRRGMSLPIWIAVGMTLVLAVVAIARRRRAPLDRSGGAL